MTTVVPAPVDPVEQLHDPDRRGRVEVSGRLVGDQDHRPVDERAGDRDALLLATGELVGHALALAVEADQLQGLGDGLSVSPRDLPITCIATRRSPVTVLLGSSRKSWNTVPIWRRSRGTFHPASRLISLPAT